MTSRVIDYQISLFVLLTNSAVLAVTLAAAGPPAKSTNNLELRGWGQSAKGRRDTAGTLNKSKM